MGWHATGPAQNFPNQPGSVPERINGAAGLARATKPPPPDPRGSAVCPARTLCAVAAQDCRPRTAARAPWSHYPTRATRCVARPQSHTHARRSVRSARCASGRAAAPSRSARAAGWLGRRPPTPSACRSSAGASASAPGCRCARAARRSGPGAGCHDTRYWRTGEDLFKDVRTDILLWLHKEPDLTTKGFLLKLDGKYPRQFGGKLLRTPAPDGRVERKDGTPAGLWRSEQHHDVEAVTATLARAGQPDCLTSSFRSGMARSTKFGIASTFGA